MRWSEELTGVLRYSLIVTTNLTAMYVFINCILQKKHPAKLFAVYYALKTLTVNIFMNQIFTDEIAGNPYLKNIYFIIVAATAVSTYAVLWYTFQGGFAKVALASILCEVAASLLGAFLIGVSNAIRGEADLFLFTGRLEWTDAVMPLGMCVLCTLICKRWGKYLRQFGAYELKHKKFWLILSWLWIGGGIVTMLPEYNRSTRLSIVVIMAGATVFGAVDLIFGIRLWQLWRRKVRQKHHYLSRQRELMRLHGEAVRRQIDRMEGQQAEIDRQMERLLAMEDLTERNRTAAIYLRKLKEQYTTIRAGIYSDDYQTDSILYTYAGIFDRMGVNTEFSFGSYRGGCLDDEEAAAVILELLETAVRENEHAAPEKRFLRLQGGTVKDQAVFRMECADGTRRHRGVGRCMRSLKRRVKRLGGQMNSLRGGGKMAMEVLLNGEK